MEFRKGEGVWLNIESMAEKPGPYTMSYGFDLDDLTKSIKRVGLVNPPLVARNQGGSFDIVSGYRRILALKALGERKVFCEDVTNVLTSPLERLVFAFYENLATRKFNHIEKAILLNKLQGNVPKEEVLTCFMPLLSLPSHEGTMKLYLKLLDLEESAQTALAREEISIAAAKALVEMEKEDGEAAFRWVKVLKLNFNQQLKFIEYVKDISIKEHTRISVLLHERSLMEVVENPRVNNPQKAKTALELLRTRRFPRLTQARQRIESALGAVSMPPGVSIYFDPYLEDPYYHLEIRFRDGEELRKKISKLHGSKELEVIPEMWAGL